MLKRMTTMEAINDSSKLIAQSIDLLKIINNAVTEESQAESIYKVIELLKTALDKLVVEIQ